MAATRARTSGSTRSVGCPGPSTQVARFASTAASRSPASRAAFSASANARSWSVISGISDPPGATSSSDATRAGSVSATSTQTPAPKEAPDDVRPLDPLRPEHVEHVLVRRELARRSVGGPTEPPQVDADHVAPVDESLPHPVPHPTIGDARRGRAGAGRRRRGRRGRTRDQACSHSREATPHHNRIGSGSRSMSHVPGARRGGRGVALPIVATPTLVKGARSTRSTIALKMVMAVTGIVFIGYVLAHMYGNLKAFAGHDAFNEYAEHLRELGEPLLPHEGALWLIRVGAAPQPGRARVRRRRAVAPQGTRPDRQVRGQEELQLDLLLALDALGWRGAAPLHRVAPAELHRRQGQPAGRRHRRSRTT